MLEILDTILRIWLGVNAVAPFVFGIMHNLIGFEFLQRAEKSHTLISLVNIPLFPSVYAMEGIKQECDRVERDAGD